MSETSTSLIKIVLVDDHMIVRVGTRMIIEGHARMRVIAEAGNSVEARDAAAEHPDIIVLDIKLGNDNGLDLLPELRAIAPEARVLVLTAEHDQAIHRWAVRRGALGVVLKEEAPETIVKAIEKLHAGEVWLQGTMIAQLLGELAHVRATPAYGPEAAKIATLTPRERDVIGVVCSGLKSEDLTKQLNISEATLRHHLTSIFGKLDVSDRVELVVYAFRHGLADPSVPSP